MELSGFKVIRGRVSSREKEAKVKHINFKAYLYCVGSSGVRKCDVTITAPENVMMNMGNQEAA